MAHPPIYMKNYANGEQRTNLVYVTALNKLLENLIESSFLTKEEKTYFKHAFTRSETGLKMVLKRIRPEDVESIGRAVRDHKLAMKPRVDLSNRNKGLLLDDSRMLNILEVMINDHCFGCHEKEFLNCTIFKYNDDLGVSSQYEELNGTCPYAYMADQEKQQKPEFGKIIRD